MFPNFAETFDLPFLCNSLLPKFPSPYPTFPTFALTSSNLHDELHITGEKEDAE